MMNGELKLDAMMDSMSIDNEAKLSPSVSPSARNEENIRKHLDELLNITLDGIDGIKRMIQCMDTILNIMKKIKKMRIFRKLQIWYDIKHIIGIMELRLKNINRKSGNIDGNIMEYMCLCIQLILNRVEDNELLDIAKISKDKRNSKIKSELLQQSNPNNGKYICTLCGKYFNKEIIDIIHIIPICFDYGKYDNISNCILGCSNCHRALDQTQKQDVSVKILERSLALNGIGYKSKKKILLLIQRYGGLNEFIISRNECWKNYFKNNYNINKDTPHKEITPMGTQRETPKGTECNIVSKRSYNIVRNDDDSMGVSPKRKRLRLTMKNKPNVQVRQLVSKQPTQIQILPNKSRNNDKMMIIVDPDKPYGKHDLCYIVRIGKNNASTAYKDYMGLKQKLLSGENPTWDKDAKNKIKIGNYIGFIIGEIKDSIVEVFRVIQTKSTKHRNKKWNNTYYNPTNGSNPSHREVIILSKKYSKIKWQWWKEKVNYSPNKKNWMPRGTMLAKNPYDVK